MKKKLMVTVAVIGMILTAGAYTSVMAQSDMAKENCKDYKGECQQCDRNQGESKKDDCDKCKCKDGNCGQNECKNGECCKECVKGCESNAECLNIKDEGKPEKRGENKKFNRTEKGDNEFRHQQRQSKCNGANCE